MGPSSSRSGSRRVDIEGRLGHLEEVIGEPPVPALGRPGSGLVASVDELLTLARERKDDSRRRRERLKRIASGLGVVAGIIAAAAAIVTILRFMLGR